jgi:hypothetical protein
MKAMTLTVYFQDGEKPPEDLRIGNQYAGGTVTAMASYDMFSTMEIAEEVLESSNDDRCIEAWEKIEKIIIGKA